MLSLSINISNPFSDRWSAVQCRHWLVAPHKVVEANVYKSSTVIGLDVHINTGDHAGARLQLGLLGYDAELHFYDTRHAD